MATDNIPSSDIILYNSPEGNVRIEVMYSGFVLDDERLKQGKRFGKDYFDELLERVREIRASERRFYQNITDIYEQCSIDYWLSRSSINSG